MRFIGTLLVVEGVEGAQEKGANAGRGVAGTDLLLGERMMSATILCLDLCGVEGAGAFMVGIRLNGLLHGKVAVRTCVLSSTPLSLSVEISRFSISSSMVSKLSSIT
jgi:hypothetical protein